MHSLSVVQCSFSPQSLKRGAGSSIGTVNETERNLRRWLQASVKTRIEMKIIHVVYSLEIGGAEVLVGQLCRLQRANGHQVSVFAYSNLGSVGEALRADGIDVYVPGEARPWVTMGRYFQRFRKLRPDVVHCHNPAPTTQAAIPARLAGVRRVITTRHRLDPLPYDVPLELKYSFMMRFCDWVVGICQVTCDNQKGAPLAAKNKIIRVYNGCVPVERVPLEQLNKQGFTLVFVGRLAPEKQLDTLIRAVALAGNRVPGLQFWVVGSGRSRPGLEALVAELGVEAQVRFWGQQVDPAPFFSSADVFVMSSLTEGLPMSLLQAMSLGVPAILTDVDGMGEILRLSEGGILVPVGDAPAMAEAIVQMALDDELRAACSARALAAYQASFTLEKMNEGYMQLYGAPRQAAAS